jgi:O-antigen ligase
MNKALNNMNNKFVIGLFFCIVLNLLPIVLSSTIIPGFHSSGIYPFVVGLNYIIQAGVIIFYFVIIKKIKLKRNLLILAFYFMFFQWVSLLITSMSGRNVVYFDYLNAIIRFISVFAFICIPSQLRISTKSLYTFMNLIIWLGLFASIYNIAVNFSGIINITNISNPYAVNFQSFYLNRNSFAQLLFFSIIANTYLFFRKEKGNSPRLLVNYLIFGVNIIATLSRTAMLSVSLFIFIFYVLLYRKKVAPKIVMLVIIIITGGIILSQESIVNFITNMLIRQDMGTTNRSNLWRIGVEFLDIKSLIFGTGYFTSKELIKISGYSHVQFHNFYIETLVGGGIVDLILHSLLIGYVLRKINHIIKNDRTTGILYFTGYISLGVYAMFESVSFVSMGYVDSFFIIFFMTVPILYANSFINSNSDYDIDT